MPLASAESRLFAWPNRAVWRTFVQCSAWLTLEWVIVYGGANWIAGLHSYRVPLETAMDRQIPFVPQASFIYLSLFPMLWLAPFRLQTPGELRRFAAALGWLIAIAGIGFLVLPSQAVRSTPSVAGISGPIFQFADWINLSFNYLPSLHVGMAVVCARAYASLTSPMLTTGFSLWAAAIIVSTLLTHQHFIVDIVVGVACGMIATNRGT
jgi:membrane-associated phospholipid phosphatase